MYECSIAQALPYFGAVWLVIALMGLLTVVANPARFYRSEEKIGKIFNGFAYSLGLTFWSYIESPKAVPVWAISSLVYFLIILILFFLHGDSERDDERFEFEKHPA